MNVRRSTYGIQKKNKNNVHNSNDCPTIADLMREQKVSSDSSNTVHHRRDLDSLG